MFIDLDNRGTGKTTSLIMDAYYTGLPIITTTKMRADYIVATAEQMGVKVEAFSVKEWDKNKSGRPNNQVLVDELEDVLNYILGAKVIKASMSRRNMV